MRTVLFKDCSGTHNMRKLNGRFDVSTSEKTINIKARPLNEIGENKDENNMEIVFSANERTFALAKNPVIRFVKPNGELVFRTSIDLTVGTLTYTFCFEARIDNCNLEALTEIRNDCAEKILKAYKKTGV